MRLTSAQVRDAVRAAFPRERILAYRDISFGIINRMYAVRLPRRQVVLRVIDPEWESPDPLRDKPTCDAARLNFWADLNIVPAPRLLFRDTSKTVIPYSYFLLSWLPGTDMLRAFPTMSLPQKRNLYRSLGAMIGEMHSINAPYPGRITERNGTFTLVPRRTAYWRTLSDEFHGIFNELRVQRSPYRKYVRSAAAFVKRKLWLFRRRPWSRLVHTDIDSTNVIVRGGRLQGLVDLDGSEFGNPEYEIAKSEHRLIEELVPEARIPEMKRTFFAAYREFSEIPLGYETRKPLLTLMLLLDDMAMLPRIKGKVPPDFRRILVRDVEHILETGRTRL